MKTCKCGETFDDSKAVSFSSIEGWRNFYKLFPFMEATLCGLKPIYRQN